MKLTLDEASDAFDLILEYGLHHREADESYRYDFIIRFTASAPAEHFYRDIKDRQVFVYSDSGITEPSITVSPGYTPSPAEEESFKKLNSELARLIATL